MAHIKLWGGLGNQLFQYSFGKYLEHKTGEKSKFFFSKATPIKKLDLEYFVKSVPFSDHEELQKNNYLFSSALKERIARKLYSKFSFLNSKLFIEKQPGFTSDLPAKAKVFDGYWQANQYLQPIESELRHELLFDENNFNHLNSFDEIKSTNSVSLHIRRGDYLLKANQELFAECTMDYYISAVREMMEKVENPVFYVFSNDINWVKENIVQVFDADTKFVFVDNSAITKDPIADLFLMSLCKHNVIANSTFSWWGAWLNKNPNKIVIAPKNWYNGNLNDTTKDLIPNSWMRI